MSGWILSLDADKDLQDIFLYTAQTWGEPQARNYVEDLFGLFGSIGLNPKMGRARDELGEGIRSFPHASHVIFFMEWQGETAILRVLHGSRYVDAAFAGFDPVANFSED